MASAIGNAVTVIHLITNREMNFLQRWSQSSIYNNVCDAHVPSALIARQCKETLGFMQQVRIISDSLVEMCSVSCTFSWSIRLCFVCIFGCRAGESACLSYFSKRLSFRKWRIVAMTFRREHSHCHSCEDVSL